MSDKPRQPWERRDSDGGERPKPPRIPYIFIGLLILLPILIMLFSSGIGENTISYTDFKSLVTEGRVRAVVMTGTRIEARTGTSAGQSTLGGVGTTAVVTYVPVFGDDDLLPLLNENGVEIHTRPADSMSFLGVLVSFLPYVLLIWIGFMVFRNLRSQGRDVFSVGKNKAKLYNVTKERTTFADVAGLKSAKEEILEIVDFLKNPDKYQKLGAETPRGVLLVGPPGTGKTLIARAIAGEAEVPFFSMSGSDFMEMFVGVGASRVRNLFKDARAKGPSIVFIDELDSVGRHRGAGLGGGHDEREQTLNQMLSEMDGFEPNDTTIVVAATNRPDILDPALLRPGRFDRRVTVGMPSQSDREEILGIHAKKKPLDSEVNLGDVARSTPGFSGADLSNLLNEAALLAARRGLSTVGNAEIGDAFDKVLMGLERRNLLISDEEKRIIAYHEAGHAIVAASLPNADPIHKVTVIPRDFSMGVTQQLPKGEKYVYDQVYLNERLAVLLGGRAAEEVVFSQRTSGAENDIKEATKLARRMVTQWGMSAKIGKLYLADEHQDVFLGEQLGRGKTYAESTAREVDQEVRSLIDDAYQVAESTLQKNREPMDKLVEMLLDRESVSGEEVMELLNNGQET